MANKYFDKFPLINYSNNVVVNITERAVILNSVFNNPNFFYPYDNTENKRPDQIADGYYKDQFLDWTMYLSNSVIDPYYDWYLSEEDFENFLKKKYGLETTTLQNKIKFYRNNWYTDNSTLTVDQYNQLNPLMYKFWSAYYDNNSGAILGYQRKQLNWTINTNSILQYGCNGNNFNNNELVTIYFDSNYNGKGQILTSNSSSITVKNVSGTVYSNTTVTIGTYSYIYGQESYSNVSFNSVTAISNNIPSIETTYWDPVSVYDYERENNEYNKSINLIKNNVVNPMAKQLKKLLNPNG